MSETVTIDCTLRDGGYYNKWDFPLEVVQDYLDAMGAAQIDYVEIGFRALQQKQFFGAHAFTTESYLKQFRVPEAVKLGVMLNASDILRHENGARAAIEELFCPADESAIVLVRIACHFHEYNDILPAVDLLREKGYLIGLNLMQIASRTDDEITQFVSDVQNAPIEALYIADSTGSLKPARTREIIGKIGESWSGAIGVHMHDNMGLALQNTLDAIDAGARFADSTVTGMGRGPGNAQTEYMIAEPSIMGEKKINPVPLMRVIDKFFKPMKERCGWGENYFYYRAGQLQIHPTYIQEMLEDNRYGTDDIIDAIEFLKSDGKKYDRELLEEALRFAPQTGDGDWCPRDTLQGRTILVVASGSSVGQYKSALESFIGEHKPYVIALNTEQSLDDGLIDLRVACHTKRILSDFSAYSRFRQPIVLPLASVSEAVGGQLDAAKFRDYGLTIKANEFSFHATGAVLPHPLGMAYALAIANSGGAEKIYLAGADGYAGADARNFDLENTFSLYAANEQAVALASVTPTLFNIPVQSVYSF